MLSIIKINDDIKKPTHVYQLLFGGYVKVRRSFPLGKRGVCVDSSYHVQINASTKRVIAEDTSIHSVHEGEVLLFSSVYI